MKMPESRTVSTLTVPFSEWVFNPAPILFLFKLYRNVKMWTLSFSCFLSPECSKMWVNPANAVLWELLFGFVPCSNYIGSRGYKSSSKIESTKEKSRQSHADGFLNLQFQACLYCVGLPLAFSTCRRYITGSFCRAPPSPASNKNMQLYGSWLSKIQLLCNKVCKNIPRSAKNVQRAVILSRRGGQAFLFY